MVEAGSKRRIEHSVEVHDRAVNEVTANAARNS
jgi:hypothetical protein